PLRTINLVGGNNSFNASRALAVDAGNHLARWLTTLPPNVLNSAGYQRALRKLARTHRWGYSFLNQGALRRLGAGAFLAVARANAHAAAGIVRLRYRATRGRNRPRVTLVGKGICFDSGGINLKPHKSMYHMHEDMQGSAVAVGTLLALSRLKVPFDIDCWLAITENEIGAHAYRPQEIVRAANGTTIQVVHSDAEGRMVLADTLALAARDKPDLIIDYATLTGACVTALTERYSGIFTNRPDWHAPLLNAGRDSGERVWPFPMEEDFDGDLDSSVADILQCTLEGKGDHILAARFLNRFVPAQTPWIHIDLAASNRSGGLAHIPSDFTGFGVRYTTELLLNHSLPGMQSSATGKQPAGKLAKRRK
ncbi:MAG TPA: M17 family metallopeptidase, partial [Povalibacter sp.]